VIGGNGDLGRHVVPHLLDEGHEVVSLDRVMPKEEIAYGEVKYIVGDVRDFGQVVAALHGCDGVIHLAAHRSPMNAPDQQVYVENTAGSYHILLAASYLGIKRVCMASSINAIGGVFSPRPRYDYFPLDEQHPNYAEDAYSLSKWVLEQQGDAFARRHPDMSIASLRFHWLIPSYEQAVEMTAEIFEGATKHLWAYTLLSEAARACLLALTADYRGHEVFYIAAPVSATSEPSQALAERYYAEVPLRRTLEGNASFFDCGKAERILGWVHV
jgi:nucleoside-diphosphate-sugar epimerase